MIILISACTTTIVPTPLPSPNPTTFPNKTPATIWPTAAPSIFGTSTSLAKIQTPDRTQFATFVFGAATAYGFPSRTPSATLPLTNTPRPTFLFATPTIEAFETHRQARVISVKGIYIRSAPRLVADIQGALEFGTIVTLSNGLSVNRDGCEWMRLKDTNVWIAIKCGNLLLTSFTF